MTFRKTAVFSFVLATMVGCSTVEQVTDMFGDSDRPTLALKDAKVIAMTDDVVTVRFDLELANHYDSALPVWGIKFVLMSEGHELHNGDMEVETALLPRSKRQIPIDVDLTFDDLFHRLSEKGPGSIISYATLIDVAVDAPDGAMSLPSLKFVGKIAIPGQGPMQTTASAQGS